jgi:hypothetical protein
MNCNQILYICKQEIKMSMKKQLLSLVLVLISFLANAQYDYTPTGRNDVPVLGMQWGLVGGGFTSMMNNRDDLSADQRLDPQMMNFTYAAGLEGIYWFQKTIGFGGQMLYWKGGAAYTGKDSINQLTMTAKSDMTYLKVPLLFHFKSYNRYYPDRRTRFSAMFGPYIAVLSSYKDEATFKNSNGEIVDDITISGFSVKQKTIGEATLNAGIYNPIDIGFVAGFGAEIRLWRRTVLALQMRADIGISDVERTKKLKITYDSDKTKELNYSQWQGKYSKYIVPNATDIINGYVPNRPPTKNFSAGVFLSIRKYLSY